jgi:hypothetical protein
VSALDSDRVFVTHFIRKLRGGSQPILAQASDGFTYVIKFAGNPQGTNTLFNESMGTEFYRAAGLPVPKCRPLILTDEFLDQNPQCWLEMPEGLRRPSPGLCFGSRYLGIGEMTLWEILPRSKFSRVMNLADFRVAWFLDICAAHTDNRQAVFETHEDGIHAVFVDHGHMFSGPDGVSPRQDYCASAYLDARIYGGNSKIANTVLNLDIDTLWRKTKQLPIEWLTDTALRSFSECLGVLADANKLQNIAELIAGFPVDKDKREFLANEQKGRFPDWLLRPGVQGAQ